MWKVAWVFSVITGVALFLGFLLLTALGLHYAAGVAALGMILFGLIVIALEIGKAVRRG